jgi:sugar phosphate isomerase/epimerase
MIFGYSTNAFVKFSLEEAIERIAALGFGGVEIMADRPHLYPQDFDETRLSGLKALISQKGLNVNNLNSFTLFAVGDTYLPSWIEPEAARREIRIAHTLRCLDLAEALGCRNISVPPGGPLTQASRKEAYLLFHRGLEKVIPKAESLGIKILIEPEPNLLMERSGQFKEFIRDVDSPSVGLNFDIGHFFCVGEDPAGAFEDLFQWVGHVHIEDIADTRKHHHLIAGQGAIDFAAVIGKMAEFQYAHHVSLELYPYVDTPEAAGRQSLEYLQPLFAASGFPA